MNIITTNLITEACFSDDGNKRYLLKKVWEPEKPRLAIVMLAPSGAAGIELDTTTQLVLNNSARLGYGSVSIVNLFAKLNDFSLRGAEEEDPENMDAIVQAVGDADLIVYAPGVGKAKSKVFQRRQEQVLRALQPFEGKLHCLCDGTGDARLQHPLSPAVRYWELSPLKVSELLTEPVKEESAPARKKRAKKEALENTEAG